MGSYHLRFYQLTVENLPMTPISYHSPADDTILGEAPERDRRTKCPPPPLILPGPSRVTPKLQRLPCLCADLEGFEDWHMDDDLGDHDQMDGISQILALFPVPCTLNS